MSLLSASRDQATSNALAGGGLALVVLTLLAYAPALYSGYVWDDDAHVTENETLQSLNGLRRIWLEPRSIPQYYPIVHTTFWLEHQLWGIRPAGYHLVNVLLHAINALLLWTLLWRLRLGASPEPRTQRPFPGVAWMAAAVFAVQPVHVESVAWVTERKNVLSGTFYVAAMLVLLPIFDLTARPRGRDDRSGYLAGFLLFVAALLSKSVTCSLPAALLLLVYWKRGRLARRDLLLTAPMFAVGLLAGFHTTYLERVHVGAGMVDWDLSFIDRGLIASRAMVFYFAKLIWPHPLVFNYPRWLIDASALWQWIFPLLVIGTVGILFIARHRIGRGPLVAVLFFGGTLFPALGFIDVYPMVFSFVADHFQYLASIGIIVLMVTTASALGRRLGPWGSRVSVLVAVLLLATYSALTFLQAMTYWDAETLWRTTIARNSGSWMARDNLAELLQDRARTSSDPWAPAGLRREASALLEESLALHQDYRAFENLAQARMEEGRAEEAAALYRAALDFEPDSPEARLNLGVALGALGRQAEQLEELRRALAIAPDHVVVLHNLAALQLSADSPEIRDPARARELAARACELTNWSDPRLLVVLAEADFVLGHEEAAVDTLEKAIELARARNPRSVLLGSLEAKRKQYLESAKATMPTSR